MGHFVSSPRERRRNRSDSIATDKGVSAQYFSYFSMKTYVVGTH